VWALWGVFGWEGARGDGGVGEAVLGCAGKGYGDG
jgi:hypothetical protein